MGVMRLQNFLTEEKGIALFDEFFFDQDMSEGIKEYFESQKFLELSIYSRSRQSRILLDFFDICSKFPSISETKRRKAHCGTMARIVKQEYEKWRLQISKKTKSERRALLGKGERKKKIRKLSLETCDEEKQSLETPSFQKTLRKKVNKGQKKVKEPFLSLSEQRKLVEERDEGMEEFDIGESLEEVEGRLQSQKSVDIEKKEIKLDKIGTQNILEAKEIEKVAEIVRCNSEELELTSEEEVVEQKKEKITLEPPNPKEKACRRGRRPVKPSDVIGGYQTWEELLVDCRISRDAAEKYASTFEEMNWRILDWPRLTEENFKFIKDNRDRLKLKIKIGKLFL